MIFDFWKRWILTMPSFQQLLLQILFGIVLVLTISRLVNGLRFAGWPNGKPLEWGILCISTLLLGSAIGHPLGAGAISLGLDTWRRQTAMRSDPLDTAIATWAIILGLLLAESQYQTALAGTLVPSIALWIYARLGSQSPRAGYFLIQLTFNPNQQDPKSLFRQIQNCFQDPLLHVYQQEKHGDITYTITVHNEQEETTALKSRILAMLPARVHFDLQPIVLTSAILGRF